MRVVSGFCLSIEFAQRRDGTTPGQDFFDSLDGGTQAKFLAVFKHVANNGVEGVSNKQLFRRERDFWAFKHNGKSSCKSRRGMIRFPCFQAGSLLVITHGFWKPNKSKWPEQEFTVANEIRQEWLQRNKQ